MEIEWQNYITVDDLWVPKLLTSHSIQKEDTILLRTYSVKFSGLKYDFAAFVEYAKESIKKYVIDPRQLKNIEAKGGNAFSEALMYFGDVNPTIDGKYGELILYLMTEAILKTPMIVFKLTLSGNDQQKGSDGIFCGKYQDKDAILLGEAKTVASLTTAITKAFDSLYRFYDPQQRNLLKYEFFVARSMLNNRLDLSKEELDYLFECFTLDSELNKTKLKVHPVLIMYDSSEISSIDEKSEELAEQKLKKIIEKDLANNLLMLQKKLENYSEMQGAYFDFFFIPVSDIDAFRHALYAAMHGKPWQNKLKS